MRYILFFLVTLSLSASALDTRNFPIAKALKVVGNVTVLPAGAMKAQKLKPGTMLKKDSSILVNGKGFARIKFINESTVTLGPNSKMVVEMDEKKETSLVNLLTGKIRAAVKKDGDSGNGKKFMVKTNAAVMGVRGTEFQVTFNPKSLRSSLLTYDGQVDIKKTKLEEAKQLSLKETNKIERIREILKTDFAPVKKGDFTNVAAGSEKIIQPVKINPAQFVLLKKDESLGTEQVRISKKEKEELKKEVQKLKKEFEQEIAADPKKQIRDLGFIDSDTGFYVPPADGKKLVGKVNTNGEYLPPKGAIVDAQKGLVVTADAPEETVALVKKVEREIRAQSDVKEIDPRYKRYFMVE